MARYQPEHKQHTHRRLVGTAVDAFRRGGIDAVGIKEIMEGLGLTVGGFYRHFASKSALVEAAVTRGLEQSRERMRSSPGEGSAWIKRFADIYLNEAHRQGIAQGCVLAALASDIARSDEPVRAACERNLRDVQAELRRHLPDSDVSTADLSWALMALELGGLLLSRMVASEATAKEIRTSCRAAVDLFAEQMDLPETRETSTRRRRAHKTTAATPRNPRAR